MSQSNEHAAYLQVQAAGAMIEAMGMVAQNEICMRKDGTVPFSRADFMQVIEKYGIYNAAMIGLT